MARSFTLEAKRPNVIRWHAVRRPPCPPDHCAVICLRHDQRISVTEPGYRVPMGRYRTSAGKKITSKSAVIWISTKGITPLYMTEIGISGAIPRR